MANLTPAERDTLNAAMEIVEQRLAYGASLMLSAYRYRGQDGFDFDITYFDSNEGSGRGQHGWVRGSTLADKLETILKIETGARGRAESNRLKRLAALRAELAKLEQAA